MRPRILPSSAFLLFVIPAACGLGGCSPLTSTFLDPHGPVASVQRTLFFQVVGWMMVVVLPVFVLVPLFAWRFRRRNRIASYRPEWTFNWPLEFTVWGVPVVIVAVLSFLIVRYEVKLDPYRALPSKEAPLEIQVIGLDWKWLFIYPDQHIATVGSMALPAGRPVHFRLTSDTVMQSFFIPALGSQIYAMAGMVTELNLEARRPGPVRGLNTQYNGKGFSQQTFDVAVLPPQDFAAWVAAVQSRGKPLDSAVYHRLAQPGTAADAHRELATAQMPDSSLYFSTVEPAMFNSIVGKYRHVADSGHDSAGAR